MENKTIGLTSNRHGDEAVAEAEACPNAVGKFQTAMRILNGKWKGEILWLLVKGKLRFGELRRSIPSITQHMLTVQLRDLERHGLVRRTIYAEVPPRVEYELTPSAMALRPVFDEILRWSEEHGGVLDIGAEAEAGEGPTHARGRKRSLPV